MKPTTTPPRLPRCPAAGRALLGAVGLIAVTAAVPSMAAGGLTVSDPWMRAVLPSRPAAGYFILTNDTAAAASLVGAASPACGMLMLHQSLHESGTESMAMVKSIPVPAHGSITFAPGGYHLMCMSPSAAVTPGHTVAVTLQFADGSTLDARFPVRGARGQ